jgi:hypothetical protein
MAERDQKSAEQFQKEIARHVLSIQHDSGVDRRLLCRRPGDSAYWFEIVTWPGTLCIHGDMGTYVFSRINDMFQFFRDGRGEINRSYWAEKLQGDYNGRTSRGMEFSIDLCRRSIKDQFRQAWRGECRTAEQFALRRECWKEVREQLLDMPDESEGAAIRAVMEYRFDMPRGTGIFRNDRFAFTDFWDNGLYEYTTRFTWCCRAIVWAIQQYDAAKAAAAAPAPEVEHA